jgi:plastocyanin
MQKFPATCIGVGLFWLGLLLPGHSATHTVSVGDNFFLPRSILVAPGDTVRWNWTGNSPHNIVCEDETTPADPVCGTTPNGASSTYVKPYEYSFVYRKAGSFRYVCTPHISQNMTGVVHVATNVIRVKASSFDPKELVVSRGAKVTWFWDASGHNVRCDDNPPGGDPVCGNTPGLPTTLYDAGYAYGFVYSSLGSFNFYCQPHRTSGMTGVVHVVNPATLGRPQPRPDGGLDIPVSGAANRQHVLETATSLVNPVWTPVATNRPAQSSFVLAHPGPLPGSTRVYRVVIRP